MKNFIPAFLLTTLFSCSSKELPAVKTVEKVDIQRFMGKWYVIANIPTFIEKNAHNAIETYTWNKKEDRIDVDFEFNKDQSDGEKKSYPQKAFIYDKKTNAEWRIQFIWPLKFAYLIMDVASDYSYTVIGVPNRGHVWIMARKPVLEDAIYERILKDLEAQQFDISKIEKVPQT